MHAIARPCHHVIARPCALPPPPHVITHLAADGDGDHLADIETSCAGDLRMQAGGCEEQGGG